MLKSLKPFLRYFCTMLALAAIALPAAAAPAPKYNVLFIAVDDLRPELGCYGHPQVQSPNIDRLAAESLQFNRAYCQFALCNPSRSSLLTGLRPETTGIYDLITFFRTKRPDVVTLPQLFKQNGYESRSFGKIFHITNGNHDDAQSWSAPAWQSPKDDALLTAGPDAVKQWKPKASKVAVDKSELLPTGAPDVQDDKLIDGQIAAAAIRALDELKDKPFFLGVGFHRPHMPWVAPQRYWDLYDPAEINLAPNPHLPKGAPKFASNNAAELRRHKDVPKKGPIPDDLARQLVHGYYASTSYMDAQVGRVLDELDRLGLRERTIVVLWGDHGYQLGEHGTWNKRTNWEIATRVPLFVSLPNQAAAGKQTDALVELIDIYPTLAELCGLAPPSDLEGKSLAPLLSDATQPGKAAAFSLYVGPTPKLGRTFGRAIRTDRYRLVEWSGPKAPDPIYELYDHSVDPQENTNVASLPENAALVRSLAEQLHQTVTVSAAGQ